MATIFTKLFGKRVQNQASTNVLVQEIHDAFNNAGDQLLIVAKEVLNKNITLDEEKEIASRLASVGFHSCETVTRVNAQVKQIELNKVSIELINHYKFYYPQNRFILKEQVIDLCDKYNLVYSEIINYIGKVPLENLKHIENFKVREEDLKYYRDNYNAESSFEEYKKEQNAIKSERERFLLRADGSFRIHQQIRNSFSHTIQIDKVLLICAPQKDFKSQTGDRVVNKRLIPDPVVLHPVHGGYLIITAWGVEAKDELVKNPNQN